ncbi:MAG: aminotransferase class V-fold PLP-dependent enzyme [Pseudomonadota bacterium]
METKLDRRDVLAAAPAAVLGSFGDASWQRIVQDYRISSDVLNLENGNWGVMAQPVQRAYADHIERINRAGSVYTRCRYWQDFSAMLNKASQVLGVDADEIALTRNATEALAALILQYDCLEPGDSVLYADLDYGAMQRAMEATAQRAGARTHILSIPEPATYTKLVDFYVSAMEAQPRTKLILLTHISHRTGLCLPVQEISRQARARGIDVIVDAAHSWGQIDMTIPALDADFVGLNCHKWIGAPLGVGILYIKRSRLKTIRAHSLATRDEASETRGRVHLGTFNYAAALTIGDALDYHMAVGPQRKADRLAALRRRWVDAVRGIERIKVLTPVEDRRLSGAITSIRIDGLSAQAVAKRLRDEHGIFTVKRSGITAGDAVRITPALYNTMADMDRCAAALSAIAKS